MAGTVQEGGHGGQHPIARDWPPSLSDLYRSTTRQLEPWSSMLAAGAP